MRDIGGPRSRESPLVNDKIQLATREVDWLLKRILLVTSHVSVLLPGCEATERVRLVGPTKCRSTVTWKDRETECAEETIDVGGRMRNIGVS